MSDEHHFENLPVLLILEIRDRSYMFYRRTYRRFQMFKKFACKPLTISNRTFKTSSLRLVSETNFGKNLSPLSISFEFRGRNRHITFIVTASAISISQILKIFLQKYSHVEVLMAVGSKIKQKNLSWS